MGLSKWFPCRIQERGRGKIPQACQAKALQKGFRCGEVQTAIGGGEFLYKLEIPEFHHEAALVDVEETVDFRLADWLLKGDAGEHFECRGREIKICARSALFAQIRALFWTSVVWSETTPLRIRS